MAKVSGRNFLLKVGVGGSPVTVASMRSTSITVNGETVDSTDKDSAGMRELLAGGGVANVSVSASGLLSGNAQATDFMAKVIARSVDPYTVVFDNGDTLTGNFQMTSFQADGQYNDAQTFSLQLESSGAVTITPVA